MQKTIRLFQMSTVQNKLRGKTNIRRTYAQGAQKRGPTIFMWPLSETLHIPLRSNGARNNSFARRGAKYSQMRFL